MISLLIPADEEGATPGGTVGTLARLIVTYD
jgi:hypothetical protein